MNVEGQIKAIGIVSILIGIGGFIYMLYDFVAGGTFAATGGLGVLLLLIISLPVGFVL